MNTAQKHRQERNADGEPSAACNMKHFSIPLPLRTAAFFCSVLLITTGCNDRGTDVPNDDSSSVISDTQEVSSESDTSASLSAGTAFVMNGHASEVLSEVKEPMLSYAVSLMQSIYDTYLADGNHQIVLSIVPDKNYYLAQLPDASDITPEGVSFADYGLLVDTVRDGCADFAAYADLFPTLGLSFYYYTDLHWKQEMLLGSAAVIADAFGLDYHSEYTGKEWAHPFVGSYSEKLGEMDADVRNSVQSDTLYYLENDVLSAVTVTDYRDGSPTDGVLYQTALSDTDKSYDLFLSGSVPLQILHSPNAATDKELIIFRDSYASALAPLLCEVYRTVTLVDLRYIGSAVLGDYLDFSDQDILFLYSTHVLNRAMIMK